MILRLGILAGLICLATAGPVAWDDSKCSQECDGGYKYQYSEQTSYIYSYESTNELTSDDVSTISMGMKATVKLTAVSKCEMVLEITDVTLQHGSVQDASSTLIEDLKKHPLPFSWHDGRIENICPNPDDSNDVNNIKKGIISALQNTMKTFEFKVIDKEVDVLGTCDTEYNVKSHNEEKYVLTKDKNVKTCTDHLKGHSFFLLSFYESSSPQQHLPILSGESLICEQTIDQGIIEEVTCDEKAAYRVLSDYGYVVDVKAKTKLHKVSTQPAERIIYRTPHRESLVFKYAPHTEKNDNLEPVAKDILKRICAATDGVISQDASALNHELVYTIRALSEAALERIHNSLKSNELCASGKARSVFVDGLRTASSGGALALLVKLEEAGELNKLDTLLFHTLLPFSSYVEEESITATLPLLRKENPNKQALLGVSGLAYRYCTYHQGCEKEKAIKEASESLKNYLGDKCQSKTAEEDEKVITALKAFGNLGYIGESSSSILECIGQTSNKVPIRIAAVEAFRRSPCKEEIVSKILEIYKNKNEDDEVRIASLLSLSRCATTQIVEAVFESYSGETSNQVKVFTWSYLKNLQRSTDPLKATLQRFISSEDLKAPSDTCIMKFSRNFQSSLFSEIFNLGQEVEANLVRSRDSFLTRSGNINLKYDFFGNQLDAFEGGVRLEDLEHILEKLLGPRGLFPNLKLDDVLEVKNQLINKIRRRKRSESYSSKIDALSERYGYSRGTEPHGSTYFRIMGNEISWMPLNKDMFNSLKGIDVNSIKEMLQSLANTNKVDVSKNLLFVDLAVLFPSVTGRAYKLSYNASSTVGLKADGRIDLRQPNLPYPQAHIEGTFQPSIITDASASFVIHSEKYEPGVNLEASVNARLDFDSKFEMKDGRLLHVKIQPRRQKDDILSIKQTCHSMNENGKVEVPKPASYQLKHCSRFLQKIVGVGICASLNVPHFYNSQGKLKVPFIRAFEGSVTLEQTEKMDGYEFLVELPEHGAKEERKYKILLDTPNSETDRKMSLDLVVKRPNDETASAVLNIYNPFYSVDVNADFLRRDDKIQMKLKGVGNKQRHYEFIVDVDRDVKGARLVEYTPKMYLSLPNVRPLEMTGTVIFSRGRKEQIQISLQSGSLDHPLNIKGNLVKEGESFDLDHEWKMHSEINITAFKQVLRLQSTFGNVPDKGIILGLGHHYEPDGKAYESISVDAKLENIEFRDRLRFSFENTVLLAEHQDLNSRFRWDFSFKPLAHLTSEVDFRYGENFEDDSHVIHSVLNLALGGDFDTLQKMDIQNKAGLTISCLNLDVSAALSGSWDLVDKPRLLIEAGLKSSKDKEMSIKYDYHHTSTSPMKFQSEGSLVFKAFKIKYNGQAEETAPHEYKGKSVIENASGKTITVDYIYKIKSDDDRFHHEFDGTMNYPSGLVKQKVSLDYGQESINFNSVTDTGTHPYSFDVKLQRYGHNEITLNTPYVEGNAVVDRQVEFSTIQADLKGKGRFERRIVVSGRVTKSEIKTIDLDISWDADNDPQKKISIKAKTHKEDEDGIPKHMISAAVVYGGSVNIDITGKVSTYLIRGPHYFRADFSGSMDEMGVEISHEIKNGNIDTVAKFLRSNVEKIRLNIKSKYTFSWEKFEVEAGALLTSPYKTFDGKEIFFRILADSTSETRVFIAEYRIRPASIIGYVGKLDYERKRGWPGSIKSNLLVTRHQRPIYQGNANIQYGNGKYTSSVSYTPITRQKVLFTSSLEHSAKFAAFHQSLTAASFRYLNKVIVNVVADLRDLEDAKVQSNLDVNEKQLYDVNATLKMKSVFDFDGQAVILSKITPSLHVFSKTQTSGQITKYETTLDVEGVNLISGSGEIKKRKKGFNGDMAFNYKGKEFLAVNINQEAKSPRERNYVIKTKTPWRTTTSTIRVNKEKKGSVSYETKFCKVEPEACVEIDLQHKESGDTNEYVVRYKRGDVDVSVERIRVSTNELSRFHTVIFNGDKRYGYDFRYGKEGNGIMGSLGLIIPSREILTKVVHEGSMQKPKLKVEFSLDARNHPDRKLTTDIRFENHLMDDKPSKLDITFTHPIYEKPIEIHLTADYEPTQTKYLTAELSLDYSNDPEDKLIGKLSIERSRDETTGNILLNIYHEAADDQHLDFVIKANRTNNDNEDTFGLLYTWKGESGAEEVAHAIIQNMKKEDKFLFDYNRPTLKYRLDGVKSSPNTLLAETKEMDLTSTYNGKVTKAKVAVNYAKGCVKLTVFNSDGVKTRSVELCGNERSRKLVSIVAESLDEDGNWAFDYELQVVRKSFHTLGVMNRFTPEFLGQSVYQLTALGDELTSAGFGKVPFYDSPRWKKIQSSFASKVVKPTSDFIVPEAKKYIVDLKEDTLYFYQVLKHYYSTLPPASEVKQYLKKVLHVLAVGLREAWSNVAGFYKNYFRKEIEFIENITREIRSRCNGIDECKTIYQAFQEAGWSGVLKEIKDILISIPDKIQEYADRPGIDLKTYYHNSMEKVKAYLEPLAKCECGEIVVKLVKMTFHTLEPHIETFLDHYPQYARAVKEKIFKNPYIAKYGQLAKEEYYKAKRYVIEILKQVDFKKIYAETMQKLEEYVKSPPLVVFKIPHTIDTEKGIIDFDINVKPSSYLLRQRIADLLEDLADLAHELEKVDTEYAWNRVLILTRRIADLNLFPPYDAHAAIIGQQHFVTFDKVFYDFAGDCTYLLSRDFQDGNFTFALKPKEGDKSTSVVTLINNIAVEINSGENTISIGDAAVELPYITEDFTISRSDSAVLIDSKYGFHVKCNLVHEICSFTISGFYYGKTAGLLGTYNYEPSDDFRRPKGQIANSPTVHAKSWELVKGCKANNLVTDVKINEKSEYYKVCKAHFEDKSSPLSACFHDVDPKEYFQLCLRHGARATDLTKALCNAAAAYVTECENNYLELSLPAKCLTCTAPDGSVLQHGDRKKYENAPKKSADVIFIIEDNECNKGIVSDIGNIARGIDRELQNEGFKDSLFGVVGFGGNVGDPQIYTVKGKTFFNSRDINAIKDRFKMEQKKADTTKAFEAMFLATKYLFRTDTSKSFVLLSCTPCKYSYGSLLYPVIQEALLSRGISYHVINSAEISVRKKKEKDIIGVDAETVYHSKDVTQKDLIGEPALRSHVTLPKDLCIALSQGVGGSYFSHPLGKSSTDIKNWRGVFARKFLKAVQSYDCRWCDCAATIDHVPNTMCQPCEMKRPRLPFSVCKSCHLPRTVESFLSLILELSKM